MGIPQLLPMLDQITEKINMSKYKDQTVAIDTYCWLHKAAYSCASQLCQNIPTEAYIEYCMKRLKMLQHFKITPILVFDGDNLPSKKGTEVERAHKREKNKKNALIALRRGDTEVANKYFQKAVNITPTMAYSLIKIAKESGIECFVAPYEADAQLAYFALTGRVDAIITEDSDLIPYGCTKVVLKMNEFGDATEVDMSKLGQSKDFRNWTTEMFRQMCILIGCDYIDESIRGLGPKNALRLMQQHRSIDRIFQILERDKKYEMPSDYITNFQRADCVFLHQRVYDPDLKNLVPLTPFPDGLDVSQYDFLGPELPQEQAFLICTGEMDPTDRVLFDENSRGELNSIDLTISNYNKKIASKGLQLPALLQNNSIQNYFIPVPPAVNKAFISPIPQTPSPFNGYQDEGDSSLSEEDDSNSNDKKASPTSEISPPKVIVKSKFFGSPIVDVPDGASLFKNQDIIDSPEKSNSPSPFKTIWINSSNEEEDLQEFEEPQIMTPKPPNFRNQKFKNQFKGHSFLSSTPGNISKSNNVNNTKKRKISEINGKQNESNTSIYFSKKIKSNTSRSSTPLTLQTNFKSSNINSNSRLSLPTRKSTDAFQSPASKPFLSFFNKENTFTKNTNRVKTNSNQYNKTQIFIDDDSDDEIISDSLSED